MHARLSLPSGHSDISIDEPRFIRGEFLRIRFFTWVISCLLKIEKNDLSLFFFNQVFVR